MRRWLTGSIAVVLGFGLGVPAAAAPAAPAAPPAAGVRALCPAPAGPGYARCFALARSSGATPAAAAPAGYGPADLRSAYGLPAGGGSGETIAVVDAFDDPTAAADLAVYRRQFGLPACTVANGCFRKVDQRGGTDYPGEDDGWAGEIALDLDMVSAACPGCRIVLVETDDNNLDNLGAGVDTAVAQGAAFVSNSYGGSEDTDETGLDTKYYRHPGVAITASTGDSGFGSYYPASSPYVTAVGGTDLTRASGGRGWAESVWNDEYGATSSGCSEVEAKPAFQTDAGCSRRTVGDLSAVADPTHGVAVYATTGATGWSVFGGTSAAAPIVAGIYALAGRPESDTFPNSYPYARPKALHDVTSGQTAVCTPRYLCAAGPGYDGPTGLGTPAGLAAFRPPGPHGTVQGTVRSGGRPVAGAAVTVGGATATTGSDGTYALTVRTGTYDVTAARFGYATGSHPGVAVAAGRTVTADVRLVASPTVAVTGRVTDGSGRGGPLAASLSVPDDPEGVVHTDPATGGYTLHLPARASYALTVSADVPGYQTVTQPLAVGAGPTSHDVALPVDPLACSAAGYEVRYRGLIQRFAGTSRPPGWSVVDSDGSGSVWTFDNPGKRPNYTGGTGHFAIVDSDHDGIGVRQDTSLVTRRVDLSSFAAPTISFHTDYYGIHGSTGSVDLSVDGGKTWATVWQRADDGARRVLVSLPVPAAARRSAVTVRFHYTGSNSWWWQLDDVSIGTRSCVPSTRNHGPSR